MPKKAAKKKSAAKKATKKAAKKHLTLEPVKGRPMLQWVGKRSLDRVTAFPAQHIESFNPENEETDAAGRLYHGDNKEVLAHLLANGYRGKVNLIYIDPPFDSGADYVRKVQLRGKSAVAKMEGEAYSLGEQVQYTDIWANDNYLQFMYERLILLKELLANDGTIWLHCDYRRAHQLRVLLDEVFGANNCLNEIVWYFYGPGSPNMSQFNRKHNNIYWYRKGETWTFNDEDVRIPHSKKTQENFNEGLEGSGFITDDYKLDDGKIPESHWEFAIAQRFPIDGKKRVDYPTEKPWALLERIIKTATSPDDLVLDCFNGSGVTAAVAQKLGRRWIGADINKGAIQTTNKRLQGIIKDQLESKNQGDGELIPADDAPPAPAAHSFHIHRVNDYDLQIQHNEAVNLACEHIGVERRKDDAYFDGIQGQTPRQSHPFQPPAQPGGSGAARARTQSPPGGRA